MAINATALMSRIQYMEQQLDSVRQTATPEYVRNVTSELQTARSLIQGGKLDEALIKVDAAHCLITQTSRFGGVTDVLQKSQTMREAHASCEAKQTEASTQLETKKIADAVLHLDGNDIRAHALQARAQELQSEIPVADEGLRAALTAELTEIGLSLSAVETDSTHLWEQTIGPNRVKREGDGGYQILNKDGEAVGGLWNECVPLRLNGQNFFMVRSGSGKDRTYYVLDENGEKQYRFIASGKDTYFTNFRSFIGDDGKSYIEADVMQKRWETYKNVYGMTIKGTQLRAQKIETTKIDVTQFKIED